jgi:hypothetical protein
MFFYHFSRLIFFFNSSIHFILPLHSLLYFAVKSASMERLDQGHLYPLEEHPGGQTLSFSPPGIEPEEPVR